MSQAFAALARQFCAWAERPPGTPAEELRTALALLPLLYEGALSLPRAWPDSLADALEKAPDVSRDEPMRRFAVLPVRRYRVAQDPLDAGATDTVAGEVAADLAGIYADLKTGLWLLERGHLDLAAAEWGDTFWRHWGRRCLGVLHALHWHASEAGAE